MIGYATFQLSGAFTDTSYTQLAQLSLSAGTFPAWVVSGGSLVDQATGSLTALYDLNGSPVSLNETITDSADQATVSMTASAGGVSGTVTDTQNGAVVATFTINPFGFGTISYSNGSTAQIDDFVIVG